jgi:hypothetical protein
LDVTTIPGTFLGMEPFSAATRMTKSEPIDREAVSARHHA